jgi:hypothetical protein
MALSEISHEMFPVWLKAGGKMEEFWEVNEEFIKKLIDMGKPRPRVIEDVTLPAQHGEIIWGTHGGRRGPH